MKVCTDACIQGAYAAQWLSERAGMAGGQRILDIGAGTGLLTLMLLQQLPEAVATAVEIDEPAFRQALGNFNASPWAGRINIFHADIRKWDGGSPCNFIISNPPFFDRDLKSDDDAKNLARHATAFSYHDLAGAISRYLLPGGKACIMLPPKQFRAFSAIASAQDIYPLQILEIKQSLHSEIFRMIGIFGKGKGRIDEEKLCIHDAAGNYTASFRRLLRDYYLYL